MAEDLKLSLLAFEIVRDSIAMPDENLEYDTFVKNKAFFDTNNEWALQYRKVFPAINRAFARLQQYGKLPYFNDTLSVSVDDNRNYYVDLSNLGSVSVKYVYRYIGYGRWKNYDFRISNDKLYILGYYPFEDIEVEYTKKIPHFTYDDIYVTTVTDEGVEYEDSNLDLSTYGIGEQEFEFVKMYAEAQITEEVDPNLANNKLALAENYFSDLERKTASHAPYGVRRVF